MTWLRCTDPHLELLLQHAPHFRADVVSGDSFLESTQKELAKLQGVLLLSVQLEGFDDSLWAERFLTINQFIQPIYYPVNGSFHKI